MPKDPRVSVARLTAQQSLSDSNKIRRALSTSANALRLSRFTVCSELDTHHTADLSKFKLAFLRRRSQVVEIVSAKDLLVVSTASGVCWAFHKTTNRRLCVLNVMTDEAIRSVFFNKASSSIVTVSVSKGDNFASLKCRSISLELLRRGQPEQGFELFPEEQLQWPGFVEFDEVNCKVLTFSAPGHTYKIWDLKNYNLLFTIADPTITEVKISPGCMLVVYARTAAAVPLAIVDVHTGARLKTWSHLLHRTKKIDFIELFNETLLVKQEGEPLQVIDSAGNVTHVPDIVFPTPSAFVFLYELQLFLTFSASRVSVWNHRGQLISNLSDHQPVNFADVNSNNIYISKSQDLIFSYHQANVFEPGAVYISSLRAGTCLGKIEQKGWLQNAPLHDVTSLTYCEESGKLYTGTKGGLVHIWAA